MGFWPSAWEKAESMQIKEEEEEKANAKEKVIARQADG